MAKGLLSVSQLIRMIWTTQKYRTTKRSCGTFFNFIWQLCMLDNTNAPHQAKYKTIINYSGEDFRPLNFFIIIKNIVYILYPRH